MADNYDIIASIVLYKNEISVVNQTIESFLGSGRNCILILIDHSPDNSLIALKQGNDRIEYYWNPANPGFGAGHNYAVQKYINKCDYFLVLNPDVYFDSNILEEIFNFMNQNLEFGQLMPKVLYPDGSFQYLCKRNPTVFDLFSRRFFPKFWRLFFKTRMGLYEFRDFDLNKIIENVPYLSGCFMFFRASSLRKIGFFDERIFMYIEDADITRRMLEEAKTVYYPLTEVYHHFAKGSHKSFKLMSFSVQGAVIYFQKWGWRWF